MQMFSFTVAHGEKGKEHTTLHHVFAVTPKKAHTTLADRYRGVPRVTITPVSYTHLTLPTIYSV